MRGIVAFAAKRSWPVAGLVALAFLQAGAAPRAATPTDDPFRAQRLALVAQLRAERDPRVDAQALAALERVPRHRFVPDELRTEAYANRPLPIGYGQTISQPYIVALMTSLARPASGQRILEIGTGSGYQAAILGQLARDVYTIEIIPELADRARETLSSLGHKNVHVRAGNGYLGWPAVSYTHLTLPTILLV